MEGKKTISQDLVRRLMAFMVIFLFVVIAVGQVSADEMTQTRHIFVDVANDDGVKFDLDGAYWGGPDNTYYIKADGGGLNELHITNDANAAYGQVTVSDDQSGAFYVTNTGGRGFDDTIVLLISVQDPIPDDFEVHIKTSGYDWTPNPIANQAPTEVTYVEGAVDETFTKEDFIYGPQTWKPGPGNMYLPSLPLYSGQNILDPSTNSSLMFLDLYVGNLKVGKFPDMVDDGAAKVEYSFINLGTRADFNGYGWLLNANQGQGISWTNRVSGYGSSGYSVIGGEPNAVFSIDDLSVERQNQAAQITDESTGAAPRTYLWDFGDGTTSSEENPAPHIYKKEGVYTVMLTVENAFGSDTTLQDIFVTAPNPLKANFKAENKGGSAPLEVNFTDDSVVSVDFESYPPIDSWAWDFESDGIIDSYEQNPTFIYSEAGCYTVTLTVSNGIDSATKAKVDFVTVE